MKILFLGAGASKSASYPLASELLDDVKANADGSLFNQVQDAWKDYTEYLEVLEAVAPVIRRVVDNPNPEVGLTQLDLLVAARESEGASWLQRIGKALDPNVEAPGMRGRSLKHPMVGEPLPFEQAPVARQGLLRCLEEYFWRRHREDDAPEARGVRSALRAEIRDLRPGDVMMTTNWDSLVERELMERRLWLPRDGYGFSVPVRPFSADEDLANGYPESSAIRVLKLHGSFGWYLGDDGGAYLSRPRFLQHLTYRNHGGSTLHFRQEWRFEDPAHPTLIAYPSYLKRLENKPIRTIWQLAAQAVQEATEFKAIGYSLPPSDTAIRVLLTPLRVRLENDEVEQIEIVDPEESTLQRWQELLGEKITIRRQRLGDKTESQ